MTNEEKASEIREDYTKGGYRETIYAADLEDALMEMAEWKDEQYAEEKKQWIEKAADYIYTHSHVTTFCDIRLDKCSMTQFVKDFKKAMEE